MTVEPFETRVEALCHLSAFGREWVLPDKIIGNNKDVILAKVLEMLRERVRVQSPDYEFSFDTTHSRFVSFDKDLGYVPDERPAIPLEEAIVGVSMSSLSVGVNDVELGWDWYAPNQSRVPVQISIGDKMTARFLTPSEPMMRWKLDEQSKISAPKLLTIPPVTTMKRVHQSILLKVAIGILALTGLIVLILKNKTPPIVFFLIPLGLVALLGAFRFSKPIPVLPTNNTEANEMVHNLLRNTYHAFDYRDEEDIYTVLEKSIEEGELLERLYLEIREGLELEISGGPRVRIVSIDLQDCKIIARNDDAGTYDVQASWVAIGNVNHWGHSHKRLNKYSGLIRVRAFEETWRIVKIGDLKEKRTQIVTRNEM